MTIRWEYTTLDLGRYARPTRPETFDSWMSALNALGEEGWEAVGKISVATGPSALPHKKLLFKRPKVDG